ncbi:peptidase domain-containing ABC transporter [Bacillus infantis]|uniref:peptidase domain-containing ABC transporter n=1 Tax=Bacillus infantis TaxID=324767 RepID=UPI002155314F|nr:peptidase domain-containing ABC transporter [Bacillus infantis]MCR6612846.1 peptidase domain-containing ABC transporter [Bacillus infantis]
MFKNRVPFVEQMSQTECGLACVAMIAAYYKHEVPLFELRDHIGNGRDGNTLYDLYKVAKDLKFEPQSYKLKAGQLSKLSLPAILYWDHKHFVVLEKVTKNKFYILDPAHGRRKMKLDEVESHFSGYTLQLQPGPGFEKRKPTSLWRPYMKLLASRPGILLTLLMMNILLQLFVLVTPLFTQQIIDNVLQNGRNSMFTVLLQGILISFTAYMIFNILRNEISLKLFRFLDYHMSNEFFTHLLKIPYSFFQVRQSGDILYRFTNLRGIRQMLSNQIMKSIMDLLLIFVILGYMIVKSPYLTAFLVGGTAVLYLVILSCRSLMHEVNRNELTNDTKLYAYQTESVLGMLDIKISGSEQTVTSKWNGIYEGFANAFIRKERTFNYITSFSGSLTYFVPLIIVWIGAAKVSSGALSLGELVAFQAISTYFISTSNSLIFSFEAFFQLKVYLRRIRDVLDTPTETIENKQYIEHEVKGEIEFQKVSYSYSKYSDNVLEDIDLKISAGEKIAIVGPSGSGKSTLAKLIMGLHQPKSGRILYDSVDLEDLDKPFVRKQMGIVTQEPFLFNESIINNIKLNKEDLTPEEIAAAAAAAQIHEEIMAMPMGYETVISEMGQNLSGGQRQRISIARALAHSPKIIVFDEATNSLDSVKEKRIDDYLSSIRSTRIVIAHRLSTIIDADQIFLLDNGRIAAQGTHQELMKQSPYYQALFQVNQDLDLKGGETHDEHSGKVLEKSVY